MTTADSHPQPTGTPITAIIPAGAGGGGGAGEVGAAGEVEEVSGDVGVANAGSSADSRRARRWTWAGLAVVLAGGLGLRVWGIEQGLPYPYNADEADHFVPHAIEMFEKHTLNPHYFANPPAYTYLLHYLYAIAYGGAAGVQHALAMHPGEVYTLGRATAAVLGTLALWLLYLTGSRLAGRGVGLLAAAIEAVAFLPVFYAHLALNDVPTLAPLTLCLLGTAGVLRNGRLREYLIAGIGLGLACATKYTAGIVLLPLLAAVAARYLDTSIELRSSARAAARVLAGLALAGLAAIAAFLIANPYAALDYTAFHNELVHQSTLSAEAQGKLGAPKGGGLEYYLWTLTWGLGWAPALAALGGALSVWGRERVLGWVLVPAPIVYLAFMGAEGRYFGRWLLPIFPILCLLAAMFALQLVDRIARRADRCARGRDSGVSGDLGHPSTGSSIPAGLRAAAPSRRLRPKPGDTRLWGASPFRLALTTVLVAVLLAQGLVYSIHSGKTLARADTRNLTREWMVAHIPPGAKIVAEPVEPEEWARETEPGTITAHNPFRWGLYPALARRVTAAGAIAPAYIEPEVGLEDYETTLYPQLIDFYEQAGYCWVIVGSTESGRAYADPREVPHAIAYYRALARRGEVVYRASPYARGQGPVAFGFDWSFDYYPLAYERPGPTMTVYRLRGGRCGS